MNFNELNIITPILRAISETGYSTPTPIQLKAIPVILNGNDILGCAQTGTGKTAAFSIPLLQNLAQKTVKKNRIRALILTPTRELAIQIEQNIAAYSRYLSLNHLVIFGGVSQINQVHALKQNIDVLIATPGRLLDLMHQGYADLSGIETLVLDEADRMLDMGFIHDVKKILTKVPANKQTLFFSATMPPDIKKFAFSILKKPVEISVTPVSSTTETIKQAVYFVNKTEKRSLLVDIFRDHSIQRSLVFSRTKHGADKLVKILGKAGINAAAIHGNKSQNARQKALENFKNSQIRVLVATDIAARGIDIEELPHVINFDLPEVAETYVHRIGRTGRAGKEGIAISFCDSEEKNNLKSIQQLIGFKIPVIQTANNVHP